MTATGGTGHWDIAKWWWGWKVKMKVHPDTPPFMHIATAVDGRCSYTVLAVCAHLPESKVVHAHIVPA